VIALNQCLMRLNDAICIVTSLEIDSGNVSNKRE